MNLLEVKNLRTSFHTRHGIVRAVNGVSFHIDAHEIVGIVGESGCGKTVLCQSVMGLIPMPPGLIDCDDIRFEDASINPSDTGAMKNIRGNSISTIFQDPMTSLNPYMRISDQIMEPLIIHRGMNKKQALPHAVAALADVGIADAARRIHHYPHEFSGGMRQRASIAMALITQPKLLFADEPTTALDVTVQAQILALLRDIQKKTGIAIVFVTHNFGVVAGLCSRVMVMYAGMIIESGETADIFASPRHPYTAALLRSLPSRAQDGEKLFTIPGQPPDMSRDIAGCPFAPRCGYCRPACTTTPAVLRDVPGSGRMSACTRIQSGDLAPEKL